MMRLTFFKKILIVLFCISLSSQKIYSYNSFFAETEFDIGYAVGKYIGIKDYAKIGLFAPLELSTPFKPFIDVRGYRFNNGKWASSAGLGIRTAVFECNVVGVNAYYDYRRGRSKGNFQQVGVGLEWLNYCWEFRVNGYIPVGERDHTGRFCSFDYGDGFFATKKHREFSFGGFDAEIGAVITSYCDFNLYGAVGPYYYRKSHQHHSKSHHDHSRTRHDGHDDFWGGYGRLEIDWRSIFSAEVIYSYDKEHSSNVQGIFRVTIPFNFFCGCDYDKSCNCCCDLFSRRVHRNGIIVTDRCCDWTWNWDDKK